MLDVQSQHSSGPAIRTLVQKRTKSLAVHSGISRYSGMKKLLAAIICMCGIYMQGQTLTFPALSTNNTFTGSNTFKNLQNVRLASQFAGADCGAKINAADTDIGAS